VSTAKRKLRLGPLPKTETLKLTFTCTVVLKAELERYAAMHSDTYGETVDAVTLIPHMLQAFIGRDRGFKRVGQRRVPSQSTENASAE
jgi:hypothetical protein